MRLPHILALVATLALGACASQPMDESLISRTPASPEKFAFAKKTAKVCADSLPSLPETQEGLEAIGYVSGADPNVKARNTPRGPFLQAEGSDMLVVLIGQGRESLCFIGLLGMTPEQSFQLAQPLAESFDGVTNAERGDGLASDVVQAWSGKSPAGATVFIAAYKGWDVLRTPGGAVRIIFVAPK